MLFYEVIASIVLENKSKTNKKFQISTLTFIEAQLDFYDSQRY